MADNVGVTDKMKGSNGKWMAKHAIEEGEERLQELGTSARRMYDRAVETGSDLLSKANKKAAVVVKEHPMQATIGGLILGFLLGASLFRQRS